MLCQALFRSLLPDIFDQLTFCRNGQGSGYTAYSTVLVTAEQGAVLVTGETDISVVFMGKCIMVWEDKNIALDLFKDYKPRSQVLAEVKAMNQVIHESFSTYPPKFCGVLTNGIDWSMVSAVAVQGKQSYFISQPCSDINLAHKLVAYGILVAGDVADLVAQNTSTYLSSKRLTMVEKFDDDDDDGGGGARDDEDVDDVGPTRKALSTLSLAPYPRRPASAAVATTSSSSSKQKTVPGSNTKSSEEHYNNYLTITNENLFNHDLSNRVRINPFLSNLRSL